jgi:hypothetical protein
MLDGLPRGAAVTPEWFFWSWIASRQLAIRKLMLRDPPAVVAVSW